MTEEISKDRQIKKLKWALGILVFLLVCYGIFSLYGSIKDYKSYEDGIRDAQVAFIVNLNQTKTFPKPIIDELGNWNRTDFIPITELCKEVNQNV